MIFNYFKRVPQQWGVTLRLRWMIFNTPHNRDKSGIVTASDKNCMGQTPQRSLLGIIYFNY